jgi:hypothetical protein
MDAGFFQPSDGGDPSTSKPTRTKRRKQWPKGWHGCTLRLAGTHGMTWNNPLRISHGMTFAPLQALTFANITENQTNRKQNDENTQIRQR